MLVSPRSCEGTYPEVHVEDRTRTDTASSQVSAHPWVAYLAALAAASLAALDLLLVRALDATSLPGLDFFAIRTI